MRKIFLFAASLTITAVVLSGINMTAKSQFGSKSSVQPEVQYQPGPGLKAKAASPTPGPAAKQREKKGSIG